MTKRFNDSQNVGKMIEIQKLPDQNIRSRCSCCFWMNEKKDVDLRMITVTSNGYHFRYVMPTKGYHLRMITDWVMIEIWGSCIRQGDIVT